MCRAAATPRRAKPKPGRKSAALTPKPPRAGGEEKGKLFRRLRERYGHKHVPAGHREHDCLLRSRQRQMLVSGTTQRAAERTYKTHAQGRGARVGSTVKS